MERKALNFNKKIPVEPAEDLVVLANTYSLSNLNYIDISQKEHIAKIMKNWLLLNELAQLASRDSK